MFPSKSKSGLPDASVNKGAPATPRAGKFARAGSTKADPASPSPQQSARLSVDRSPQSVDSKHTIEHRSPKITTPDKQLRAAKGSELQAQLTTLQEELNKAKERLTVAEKEKNQILEELKYAKRCADEANDKLQDALVSQRIAEEAAEIDKFRADELEQAGLDTALQKEEEWHKELEAAHNQHAVDVAALLATTQELQRAKQELAMTTEAKNSALGHADDAMKIAEINADKVEFLSREVNRLKALLDSESKKDKSSEIVEKTINLQAQLNLVQEELKKANERLVSVEAERTHILQELKEATRSAEETNEKLKVSLAAQNMAEYALETYKICTTKLENERIENAQKIEQEWQKKIETAENQNALNLATLLSTMEELEKVKHELTMAVDAKDTILTQACDAMMSAEINAVKLELLSGELSHLKALLDSKVELESEISSLRNELDKAKYAGNRLVEMEALVDELRIEVSDAKKAETDTSHLMDEWRMKAELLEVQLEETSVLKLSSMETLASVMKQLQESNAALQDKECQVTALSSKVESLNLEVVRHKIELDGASQQLDAADHEAAEMGKIITALKSELEKTEAAKLNAMENEKEAISNIQRMTEERKNLQNELVISLCELAKTKNTMESLVKELHEVSTEARETQGRFLTKQSEVEDSHAQIEELKMTIKKNKESYEVMLEKVKDEIVCLQDTLERFERELDISRSQWDLKVVDFVTSIIRSEEEITLMRADMEKMTFALKEAELRAREAKVDALQPLDMLKPLESEETSDNIVAEVAQAEVLHLKELLILPLETENDSPQILEPTVLEVQVLDSYETAAKKQEGGTLSNLGQSQITMPVDFSEDTAENVKAALEVPIEKLKEHQNGEEILHGKRKNSSAQEEEQLETELKVCENGKIVDKDLSIDKEHETESVCYEEMDSKMDGISFNVANGLTSDVENGAISPDKQQQQLKKKKAFMQKFGNLLKKKTNHK